MSFTFICQDNAFMLYLLAMDNQILAHLPVSCFFPLDLTLYRHIHKYPCAQQGICNTSDRVWLPQAQYHFLIQFWLVSIAVKKSRLG